MCGLLVDLGLQLNKKYNKLQPKVLIGWEIPDQTYTDANGDTKPKMVYNRYTAGRVSPVAVRNYIAYVYSVCPNFKYVLLVGAGNFDYRGFDSKLATSYFPPFEKEDGVYEDFFGVLDSGEVVQYGEYDLATGVQRCCIRLTMPRIAA